MVDRMKPLLNMLILENQTTFVLQRAIQDNLITAHEAFHGHKRRNTSQKAMAIKLDTQKLMIE